VLVVGAAGVGTSRLVAAALGEVALGAGRIEVLGRDVGKLRRSSLRLLRRRIGIVPQDLCLLEDRSAQLNVALPLEIDGVPRSASFAAGCARSARSSSKAARSTSCSSTSNRCPGRSPTTTTRFPTSLPFQRLVSREDANAPQAPHARAAPGAFAPQRVRSHR